jgi:translation initiation factor IF-1
MSRDSHIEFEGTVVDINAGGNFIVQLETGVQVNAKLSGKMRHNKIKVVLGDKVRVAFSPYDSSRGLIVFRSK